MRTISRICIVGIGMGVGALILVTSVMNGFNDSLKNRLLAIEPHLVIEMDHQHEPKFWQDLLINLQARPGVSATFFEGADVVVRTPDGFVGGAVARGVSREALARLLSGALQGSQRNSDAEVPLKHWDLKPGEVLMGVDLAVSLGVFEDSEIVVVSPEALLLPLGEIPAYQSLRVRDVVNTKINDIDAKYIYYVRGSTLQHLRDTSGFESGIELRVNELSQVEPIQAELAKKGVRSQSWSQRNTALFYALKLEKLAIATLLSLSALIASFSIVSVLMLLMTQKRKDIGILMAMGLSRKQTQLTFAGLGLILSLLGIGGGGALGLAISYAVSRFPIPILPEVYHDRTIPARVNLLFVGVVIFVSVLVAIVSSWIPAQRNARSSPSEALRGRNDHSESHRNLKIAQGRS